MGPIKGDTSIDATTVAELFVACETINTVWSRLRTSPVAAITAAQIVYKTKLKLRMLPALKDK